MLGRVGEYQDGDCTADSRRNQIALQWVVACRFMHSVSAPEREYLYNADT